MNKLLCEVRKEYGGVFITQFPDERIIPWKLLSIQDWLSYQQDYSREIIAPSYLEDEIFKKCVLDETIVRNIDYLPAGVVSTVVVHIWQYSGPSSSTEIKQDLEVARSIIADGKAAIIYDFARLIGMAFPYKPEEIYALPYDIFMQRVAEAEVKLLSLGIIQQPIVVESLDENISQSKKINAYDQLVAQGLIPNSDKKNAKQLYEEQQSKNNIRRQKSVDSQIKTMQHSQDTSPSATQQSREKWWKKSPILEANKKHNISFDQENQTVNDLILDSHDINEPEEVKQFIIKQKTQSDRDKMIRDALILYKDTIEELKQRQK